MREPSRSKSFPADIAGTSSQIKPPPSTGLSSTLRPTPSKPKSSTVESRHRNKKPTSIDKSTFYLTNTPNTALSKTLDQGSTLRGPDFYPFWDSRCKEEYRKWSLPQKIDSVDSPLISSPGSSKPTEHASWFSIKQISPPSTKSEKTSSPSCKYSHVDGTAKEGIAKPKVVRKIRVYPTLHQKQLLARMAGTSRAVYNAAAAMIRDKVLPFESQDAHEHNVASRQQTHVETGKKGEYKETAHPWLNFIYMRNYLVNNKGSFVQERPWMKETVNSIRQVAVQEAIANYKAALSNLKAGNIKQFSTPFRSKKSRSWSIGLDPTQLRWNRVLPASDFGELRVAERSHLKKRYTSQPRITRDRYMNYYLVLIEDECETPVNDDVKPVMAIDPGIRTRHAIFSTEDGGQVTDIGSGDIQRIIRIAKGIDKKISASHSETCNHKQRRRLLKQRLKLTRRIADLKKEMDYQTITFLQRNASLVLLPSFEVHAMACRLRHKTARQLLCWGHGLFKQRLLERSKRSGIKVMIVSEHYTSKTCGSCGLINERLGGKKIFSCQSCGFCADRDHNGARNIFLRALRKA